MLRKISASEFPCLLGVRVRSGPRPPPRAPRPWQNAQLDRNWNSPSFAALGSLARGFVVCVNADKQQMHAMERNKHVAHGAIRGPVIAGKSSSPNSEAKA